jgi:protein-tyrosine-phosphatase
MPFTVLLVCTGNTCRSAMAEGILSSMIPEDRVHDIRVESAGTAGFSGAPATEYARDVCSGHGVDIGSHISHALTASAIDRADLVLAMTRGHVDEVNSLLPQAVDRISLLSEFAEENGLDVPDPIGAPREEYERVYSMIEDYLTKSLPTILRLAGEEG